MPDRRSRMTVIRMTSPVTPGSTSPDSSNEAQALQATSKPTHRLSFSVAALLEDTRKTPESSAKQDPLLMSSRSSPVVSYLPIRQEPRITINTMVPKHLCDLKISRYTSLPNQETRLSHCVSPHNASDSGTPPRYPEVIDFACSIESPSRRSTSGSVDYRIHPPTDIRTTPEPMVGCSSSPKIIGNHQDAGSQSPTNSSHGEIHSRCSETDDVEEDDESRLVDVEDLQHHPSSPTPVRPTPAYLGGFSTLGGIPGIPPNFHSAMWGGGHQNAAAAAAAAAAATFFPSHFSHHAPLNGKCHIHTHNLYFNMFFK